MSASLDAVPRRLKHGALSALGGLSYPELVQLFRRMKEQDPRIIFDSLRPFGDEFWNLIDGRRTLGEIAEAMLIQFDFDFDPALFVPWAEGMARAGMIALEAVPAGKGGEGR